MNSYLASLGPSLANHVWQSTIFATIAWLLTLVLRRNRARMRYGIWLAASIKFLVPFTLLASFGNLLPSRKQPVAPAAYSAIDVVEEPFAATALQVPTSSLHATTLRQQFERPLPACLGALWLAGVGTVLFGWRNRWRVVSATLHHGTAATKGRELQILRRLESVCVPTQHREVLSLLMSAERMEPGVFGIFRPVLIWPEQLSEKLDDEHIEAIFAHELAHVANKDNLTAAAHMLVEALFWFHPLVWWMERQMVKERERACDEAVVEMGRSAETYAESLLKTCRFCIESPLPCVAGITGADLKRRVTDIITGYVPTEMSWPKRALLVVVAVGVLTVPMVLTQAMEARHLGEAQTAPLSSYPAQFEVASVRLVEKPSGDGLTKISDPGALLFTAHNVSLPFLIQMAFGLDVYQIEGQPAWMGSTLYDVSAKPDSEKGPTYEQLKPMLQHLLAQRFHLQTHTEEKEMKGYSLVVAKGGQRLMPSKSAGPVSAAIMPNRLQAPGVDAKGLASILSMVLKRPVHDNTGLQGKFDLKLNFAPLNAPANSLDSSLPSVFTAVQEQLGLKLEPAKVSVQMLVIDHADRLPTEN